MDQGRGGAQALAAEALVKAGVWSETDRANALQAALGNCAEATRGRALLAADRAGVSAAIYDCGHVIAVAAGGREGPAAFWRALLDRAINSGVDEALFYDLVAERRGAALAAKMKAFSTTNYARSRVELKEILEAALGAA